MKQQRSNRISSGVIAGVSAAVIAVSGAVAWLTWNSHSQDVVQNSSKTPTQQIAQPTTQPTTQSTTQPTTQPTTSPPDNRDANEQTAEIYWLQDTGQKLALVPEPVKIQANKDQPDQFLAAAFQSLLAGPKEATNSTTIPKGTKLLGVKMENNAVHVDLSEQFSAGGGSSSMMGRVGQVVYTATALNPNAKVYIDVNGKQLDVLGGEGLELEQPLTRESFNKNYSL